MLLSKKKLQFIFLLLAAWVLLTIGVKNLFSQATGFQPSNWAPASDNGFDLGLAPYRWRTVYAYNANFNGTFTNSGTSASNGFQALAGQGVDTQSAGTLVLGQTNATAITLNQTTRVNGGISSSSYNGTAVPAFYLNGDFPIARTMSLSVPPGPGVMTLRVRAGTVSGTCKLVAVSGTSTVEMTIIDNVGGGC